MANSFLQEELGVAMSGVKWDIGNYKLWQSTRPNIILFTPRQPTLAINPVTGRYQFAMAQYRQQTEDTYKITGGSAVFAITTSLQHDAANFERLKEQWLSEMGAVGPEPPRNPRFIPLNVQKGEARVLIDEATGTADQEHNDQDVGTPGGTLSFLVNLTELGAQLWSQGIKERTGIPGGVAFSYEYLRMMPDVGARVIVHGNRLFQHVSADLNTSARGFWYGGSAQIEAMWERMSRDGSIEIIYIGAGLPPELEEIRRDLTMSFADQARERMFNMLFEPAPDVEPAEAGDTSGWFGGTNFAFKYRRESEVLNLEQTIRFQGWTWLKARADPDLVSLLAELDASYVTEVNTQMSFPASVVVGADPQLQTVALSWSASEGKAPEAPVFGGDGGNEQYTVTSQNPDDVEIRYRAQVNFAPGSWPVVETEGRQTVAEGGNQVVIKPSSWIGRHMIYMYVRDGEDITFDLDPNDHLVCNVTYNGSHLANPIRASARITPFEPLEFSYPMSPDGTPGEAKFSAFGVIGGRMVRAQEQAINFDEEAVFILASSEGIQLVSESAVFAESDRLAGRLLRDKDRPRVETRESEEEIEPRPGEPEPEKGNGKADGEVVGMVVGVEYGFYGPALIVETDRGIDRIRVRTDAELYPFANERKQVKIRVEQGYAKRIFINLPG